VRRVRRLDYKDFHLRRLPARAVRLNAIPESKQAFLARIDAFLEEKDRELVSVETHEGFFRVWYRE